MIAAFVALILAAAVVVVGGGATVYVADGAAPGSALYGVDQAAEQVRLNIAGGEEERAALLLKFAEERLLEAQELAAENDPEFETTIATYNSTLDSAVALMFSPTIDQDAALTLLDEALTSQDVILAELYDASYDVTCTDSDGDGKDDVTGLTCDDDGDVTCTDLDGDGKDDTTGAECDDDGDLVCTDEDEDGIDDVTGEPCDTDDSEKVTVCHVTGSEGNPTEEIIIDAEDLDDHLAHGDTEGACEDDDDDDDDNENENENANENENSNTNENENENENANTNDNEGGEEGAGACVGADPHPVGERLSEQYGVPYETIMDWFCGSGGEDGEGGDRNGFGEIRQAYNLAEAAGVDVEEIFALRAEGTGWGQIRREYGIHGNGNGNGNRDDDEDGETDGETDGAEADGPGNGNGNGNGGNGNGNGNGNSGGTNGNGNGNGNSGGTNGNGNGNGNGGGSNGNGNGGGGNGNGNGNGGGKP